MTIGNNIAFPSRQVDLGGEGIVKFEFGKERSEVRARAGKFTVDTESFCCKLFMLSQMESKVTTDARMLISSNVPTITATYYVHCL